MLRNNADARRCSYFELGLPVEELAGFSVLAARKMEREPKNKRGGRETGALPPRYKEASAKERAGYKPPRTVEVLSASLV